VEELKKTEKTKLARRRMRGFYDRQTVNGILDSAIICHVAYVIDGQPVCTPTLYWREGNHVYWHGSAVSRFLGKVAGQPACFTVTHIDSLILARSAFHHSAAYRSVMLFGRPEIIDEPVKSEKLRNFIEHLYPGRWETLRPMTKKEAGATTVLGMEIDEGSAKVKEGGPVDDEADYALPIWAGDIPVSMAVGTPIADPRNIEGLDVPTHVKDFSFDHLG
jgi:nitroimidazol reductase NimA-like FMN-containing flavoprotein (pyridoxamine 5'-phosphate oxidase superfamily)